MRKGLWGRDRLAASPLATLLVLLLLLISGGKEHTPRPQPDGGSLSGRVIVVDPGHGGNDRNRGDFGAEGVGPVPEKENALAIGLALKRELEALGARVVMTRESDRSPADDGPYRSDPLGQLKARVETARQVNADAFISVHNDWSDDPRQEGVASFHYSAASRRLAEAIQRGMAAATGAQDRGVHAEDFYVLRHTPGPAVLVETGFVSNRQEAYRLSDPAYRARVARGIAQGVAEVLGR
ncbi:cell wall hydrolase [Limnochorda pilosa]|uniref:Cell wall hydrolase n=1 Tax=Limnochorda pilosa TaxID=1555112 RepID=A0A0K2SNC9_LIMPI|nr:cell wall hydrolase [Limnochorda pilosa]